MVRVWYEPPPYGPGTDLNRSGYGVHGGGIFKGFLERASRVRQPVAMAAGVGVALVLAYIPVSKSKLFTMWIDDNLGYRVRRDGPATPIAFNNRAECEPLFFIRL